MCCGFAVKTRASWKNRSSFRLAIFLRSPTDRFHAPFTAKPGHISQSPRSVLGVVRLNISIGIRDGAGAGENQRFIALEVAGTRMERVLHLPPARHTFLFPNQKGGNGVLCALTLAPSGTQQAATCGCASATSNLLQDLTLFVRPGSLETNKRQVTRPDCGEISHMRQDRANRLRR